MQFSNKDTHIVTYKFTVDVVSGQLKGKKYEGYFTYDESQLKQQGDERINLLEAQFKYLGHTVSKFDGIPKLVFRNGKFQHLIAVGGSRKRRFGFNGGFSRSQFCRPEEAFIRQGKDFFGYLDPDTYVEGAGIVTYKRQLEPSETGKAVQNDWEQNEAVLTSKIDSSYRQLRDLLQAGQWKEADEETGRIILQVTGPTERGWLTDEEIENFPGVDLGILDELWRHYSEGRFGFSVQKSIWTKLGENYENFSDSVGWRVGNQWLNYEDLDFSAEASWGHLPVGGFNLVQEKKLRNQCQQFPVWVSQSRIFRGRRGGYLLRSLLENTH